MTNKNVNTIKILFVCHGNMLRGIPTGLNVCERKNVRKTLKNHD